MISDNNGDQVYTEFVTAYPIHEYLKCIGKLDRIEIILLNH